MSFVTPNLCIRCGKARIFVDSFVDTTIATLPVKVSNFACPDAECQKIVDEGLAEKRLKRLLLIHARTVKRAVLKT